MEELEKVKNIFDFIAKNYPNFEECYQKLEEAMQIRYKKMKEAYSNKKLQGWIIKFSIRE